MPKLKNPPLLYALGMIRFPRIPAIEEFVERFFEKVQPEYPIDEKAITQQVNASFTSEGIKVDKEETQVWQFASSDLKWAFVLNNQTLCLHTSCYEDFDDYIERFTFGMQALIDSASRNAIPGILAIGLRYVNIITKEKLAADLDEYLQPWILPPTPKSTPLEMVESVYFARYKTSEGEMRLQSFRNPQFTLSPDLNSEFIVKNNWVKEKPDVDFALVDIDHLDKHDPPHLMKLEMGAVCKKLKELRNVSRSVFNSIGTKKAKNMWGLKK